MSEATWHAAQLDAGAFFADAGDEPELALHYGDPREEDLAARSDEAVFDFSTRCQVEITGADRVKFLHNFCTNDIRRLEPGRGCEAFIANVKGRVLAHVYVFASADALWLETVGTSEAALLAHLERYVVSEDVSFHSRSAQRSELLLTGLRAGDSLRPLGVELPALEPGSHSAAPSPLGTLLVRCIDMLRQPCLLVSMPREQLVPLWQELVAGGARPTGTEVFHAQRIEAVFPLYGRDITDEHLVQEVARTAKCVSFTKGCYLGQEPIARIDALGHVNRELCGLKLVSAPVPPTGSEVLADDSGPVGTITSSAVSYVDDQPVALAYLRSKHARAGTSVRVRFDGRDVEAAVFRDEG